MSFREEFLKFKQPSPQREQFVYESAIKLPKQQILDSMKPIKVKRPDGAEITFKVMPDYLMIEGMRVPMSGVTAQRVADYFGLRIPTPKMSQDIYNNADVKISAKPLSGTGTVVGDKRYSGRDVVNVGVGHADFVSNYNQVVDNQLSNQNVKPDQIVSGFAKDVTTPVPGAENKLGLHGFYQDDGKPIQGGSGQTPHDTNYHTEYGAFVRLVSPETTITYPDGRVEKATVDSLYQYARYKDQKPKINVSETSETRSMNSPPSKSSTISLPYQNTPSSQNDPIKLLDQIMKPITGAIKDRRNKIIKRAIRISSKL